MTPFHDEVMHSMSARSSRGGQGETSLRGPRSTVATPLFQALLLALLFWAAGAGAGAQTSFSGGGLQPLPGAIEGPRFLPVEEAYPLAVESTGERQLRLVWQMPPGYYLYQHAFRFRLLRDGGSAEPAATFPEALAREDEYFGRVQVYYDSVEIPLESPAPLPGATLEVTSQGCADAGLCYPPRTQRFSIDADGGVTEVAASPTRGAPPTARDSGGSGAGDGPGALLTMALLAFAGGVILNLMPCVFPILSLKVLAFTRGDARSQRSQGWYYSAGVLLSFVAVACLLLLLRGAGQAIGWGFQLQSPTFVIALAYLFTAMALSLSGVIEFGGSLMNVGSGLASRQGAAGSFFTGVLAVLVACPCTAPFMGTALGFALSRPPLTALAIFLALGAGMAAPLLLLSHSDAARRRLPAPGPWMEKLRQALAFPLYATALWLFWVAGRQLGVNAMAAALFGALLLALALWSWGGGRAARTVSLACAAGALLLALWRPAGGDPAQALAEGRQPYSPQALEQLLARGEPVFVDVTADWCITCLANERAVLDTAVVRDAFETRGVTYMVADWTDYDPLIADFVASHGRSGIPLYVLYDPAGGTAPRILPQLLRRGALLEVLESVSPGPREGLAAMKNQR